MLEEHNAAWEYCELELRGIREHKQGWSYDCHIRYYTVDGAAPRQLAGIGQLLQFNPFTKAMALLGAAGWELVSVQHGNWAGSTSWDTKVAFFKRPVVAGRAINEPELVI